MKKLYLDVDGVLLTAKNTAPTLDVLSFIDFVTIHFDCFWLTTHCKGDNKTVMTYLSKYFDQTVLDKLQFIKPTHWNTLKPEAIDFSSDFVWLDDYPFNAEIEILRKYSCENKLIIVNLMRGNELMRIKNCLL